MPEEEEVVDKLLLSFQQSEKLRRHMSFLMREGKLYLPYNGNLLIHGCIPVDENGEMESFEIEGEQLSGRELLDVFEYHVRKAFDHKEITDDISTDLVWYLWTGKYSSLFGKRAMTTFERYFIEDKASHKEEKNPYYHLREDVDMIRKMLKDFGLNPDEGRIINGHTPVKEIDGEDQSKLMVRCLSSMVVSLKPINQRRVLLGIHCFITHSVCNWWLIKSSILKKGIIRRI